MLQSEPVKKLQAFAENNKETQGKFTIGDEKVNDSEDYWNSHLLIDLQQHNVFMRMDVSPHVNDTPKVTADVV